MGFCSEAEGTTLARQEDQMQALEFVEHLQRLGVDDLQYGYAGHRLALPARVVDLSITKPLPRLL